MKLQQVKKASHHLRKISDDQKKAILHQISARILKEKHQILEENAKDLTSFPEAHPNYDRLKLTTSRLQEMADHLLNVANLPSPLDRILSNQTQPNGLNIKKISVPLGVVGVIYESRPNVTLDVFALCFKSGNTCILKGGKEALHSNQILVKIIQAVLQENRISTDTVYLMPPEKASVYTLLNAVGYVDVCIPRGGKALIEFVRENAKIPVIETGAGIVHTYFDQNGDLEKGRRIITNAKTRRVSVCNALDTLVIHEKRLTDLPYLLSDLAKKEVTIFADFESHSALKQNYPETLLKIAKESDFGCEFLSYQMAIKTVNSLEEAIKHITRYTSHHSEAIITEEQGTAQTFTKSIDAGVIYVNASTAFTDGAQFGMGAEIGISTQKLHARGPMGLEALTSYQWLIFGNGQIRE